jgi:hypothetical protein
MTRGEAVRRDHDSRVGRLCELRVDDPRKGQIAERPVAVPALEPGLGDDPPWLGVRVQIGQGRQPSDSGDAVAGPPAAIGVFEVLRERPRVGLGEAETTNLVERAQAETSGSGLTMPTPCSRFVAAIASASATIARETSASGSTSTIGSPSSA